MSKPEQTVDEILHSGITSSMVKKFKPIRVHSEYIYRIGLVSDLHIGAATGLFPEKYKTDGGQTLYGSELQQLLLRQWKRIKKLYDHFKVDMIITLGDMFSGQNPIERGTFVLLPEMDDQLACAEQILHGVTDKRPNYHLSGTAYHELKSGLHKYHLELSKDLNGEFLGPHAYLEFECPRRTRRVFMSHEAPTGLVYPATLMSRDIMWSLMGEATGNTMPVDAIVRAHIHKWLHVDHDGKHAVQLPCFQGHVPYKTTIKYYFKLQPTIGAAMMLIDKHGRFDFWGGSFPFSPPRQERIAINLLTMKTLPINAMNKGKIVKARLA